MKITETCPCGAQTSIDGEGAVDDSGKAEATRAVNTWRKYHHHSPVAEEQCNPPTPSPADLE